MSTLQFSDSEDVEWRNEVSTSMLMHGSEPGPSHETQSWSDTDVEWMNNVPMVCDVCKKTFSNKSNLKRHMKKHEDHACSQCSMKFYRVDKLQEHMRTHTREKTHPCEQCDQVFPCMSDLLRHKRTDHSAPPAPRIAAAHVTLELWSESSGSVFFPFHDADSCWEVGFASLLKRSSSTNPRYDCG
ncbi:hypothetical protein AVEN_38658-1 [Araneus ventricosus]|uniref:C2H2-type domain-containing protein n=1 Tax=Araneus ventricosus TaxID=182803 RepID=A0A4Y2T7R7_ARAVE|nr:hypothetical protein AVEN_38658-1 [Araneus ventricosus]